ncbi:helix-hairpin-helix domain-containing protein [Pseudomonadota bacterium]
MSSYTLNQQVAEQLREIADLLEQQLANPFRINAYRHAADTVDRLGQDLQALFDQQGMDGLIALPGIGRGISRTIYEILTLGRSSRLESLRGELDPVRLFSTIPGVGPETAHQIHDHLQLDSLEALEIAAHDGRLEQVPGVGLRRASGIRAALANMLGQRIHRGVNLGEAAPPVDLLLDVDREYREKAERGLLPTISPRRFNPEARAWLPILHTSRGEWHCTALYSNTARAHALGHTHDWVVISCYDEHHHENQNTVVTETHGKLAGRRVVRGREKECGN